MLAAVALIGLVVFGLGRLSQVTRAPSTPAVLRAWVIPARASASSTAESCQLGLGPDRVSCAAALAIDSNPQTAWCEGAAGDGAGERLTVYLDEPGEIEAVRIKAGYQKDEERFLANRAPTTMTVLVGQVSEGHTLEPALHTFSELRLPRAVRSDAVTLVIRETTEAPFEVVCISEVELQVQR
jgi:hypothetical protein